jgi:hypothetical protein
MWWSRLGMAAQDCERLVRITSENFVIICGSVDVRQCNVPPTCFYLCAVPSIVHLFVLPR